MKVGVASASITPPVGVPMAGYGARKGVSKGIHDDLYAKAIVFDEGDMKAALIRCDLIGLRRGRCQGSGWERGGEEHSTEDPKHADSTLRKQAGKSRGYRLPEENQRKSKLATTTKKYGGYSFYE